MGSGEQLEMQTVSGCLYPTVAIPNSGCGSVYPGMESGGDKPSFYLAFGSPALAIMLSLMNTRKEECTLWWSDL